MDRRWQHSLGSPPPLRPKRAAQTAAQGFAPADYPTTTANQKKGDTSNEVRKGTFLKRLDSVCCPTLTRDKASASIRPMAKPQKSSSSRGKHPVRSSSKQQKQKVLAGSVPQRGGVEMVDPRVQAQMKVYEEAMAFFHQQKFQRAKQELEKVLEGPSKELADRARMHLRIVEQRMKPSAEQNPKSPEDHYQRGVAMMNLGRWAEARQSLEKARTLAPKLDHVHYALAAFDGLP